MDDDPMLAGWKRSTAAPKTERPKTDAPRDTRSDARPETRPDAPPAPASDRSAGESIPGRAPTPAPTPAQTDTPSPSPSATSTSSGRTPIAARPPVQEEEDEPPPAWSYGLRDPFAEAEARERAVRRWVLMIALLVATTIFLILQWAYSRPNLDDRAPPGFEQGLVAYRDGAFVSAARAWTPAAEAGDVEAMHMLGWMAEFGQGRPWSNRDAASWYRQAAERGHAPSQLRLADLYRRGLGVDLDLEAALAWYLQAAQAGVPRAQREAALVLARLDRVEEARAWLARAATTDPDAAAWWRLVGDGQDATNVSP